VGGGSWDCSRTVSRTKKRVSKERRKGQVEKGVKEEGEKDKRDHVVIGVRFGRQFYGGRVGGNSQLSQGDGGKA